MTVSDLWKTWRSRQVARREFRTLDPTQREEIARDAGIDLATLEALSGQAPYYGTELERLMGALALDPDTVKRGNPGIFRDMSVVCSGCIAHSRCRRHLDNGTARGAYTNYCPNALTLTALWRDRAVTGERHV
jgi:hypothetical protein